MEKKITSFSEIKKSGTIILVDNFFIKDNVMTYCGGNEDGTTYYFMGDYGSSFTPKESDDPTIWNVRVIDKKHPKYDKDKNEFGSFIDKFIKQEVKDVEKKIKG
jgi:hypothetical protein